MISYASILAECRRLRGHGAALTYIGKSVWGNLIPAIRVGLSDAPPIVITAAIHARESLSAAVVLQQAWNSIHTKSRFCVWYLPILNPDGNLLCHYGLSLFDRPEMADFRDQRRKIEEFCGYDYDYRLYKANGRGVDLNVNFDARFGTGKSNVFAPAPENYVGPAPFSEPETAALKAFTEVVRPAATVSYHAKGRELYWYFHQTGAALTRDARLARRLNEKPGYRIVDDDGGSAGGYKDWCIETLSIPAFTFELIDDAHPHPLDNDALTMAELNAHLDMPEVLFAALAQE